MSGADGADPHPPASAREETDARQGALPFGDPGPDYGRDRFITAPANQAARAAFITGAFSGALALTGPPSSGKTHLLTLWVDKVRAELLTPNAISETPTASSIAADRPLALDDAHERLDPAIFLRILKRADAGLPTAIAGRGTPDSWARGVRDLETRLAAARAIRIDEPDDDFARRLLRRHLERRGLAPSAQVLTFACARAPRSHEAIAELARRIDRLALEAGAGVTLSLSLVRAALDEEGRATG